MNLIELYEQVPAERHHEIVISDDSLYFDGVEYAVLGDGELRLVHSDNELLQKVDQIRTKLGISK